MIHIYVILNILAVALLVQYFLDRRNRKPLTREARLKRQRILILLAAVVSIPILISGIFLQAPWIVWNEYWKLLITFLISGSISGVWIGYVLSLDIFDKERWYHVLFVFIGACLSTFAVFPLTDVYVSLSGNTLNGNPITDFIYCVLGIGLVEEIVKIIPVLLIIRWSKAVKEPYDYLLYASVAALGFAFIENIIYLDSYNHKVTNARALYASVAHMSFSSIVAYSMMISIYRWKRGLLLGLIVGLALAALAHGFYDFWLINGWATQFAVLSTLFFIATVHLWTVLKNNAMNLSPYFRTDIELRNDWLKSYLALGLLSIAMLSFFALSLQFGFEAASKYMWNQLFAYGYIILYLIFGLSNYDLIRSYLAPLQIPYRFLIPNFKNRASLIGKRLSLSGLASMSLKDEELKDLVGKVSGTIREKMMFRGDPTWYLMELDSPIKIEGFNKTQIAISSREESPSLENEHGTLARIMLFKLNASNSEQKRVFSGYLKVMPESKIEL